MIPKQASPGMGWPFYCTSDRAAPEVEGVEPGPAAISPGISWHVICISLARWRRSSFSQEKEICLYVGR